MNTESQEEMMDRASFEILNQNNPKLIQDIQAALALGASAKDIENRILSTFKPCNLLVNMAVCAAYYLEKHPQEKPSEQPDNSTNS